MQQRLFQRQSFTDVATEPTNHFKVVRPVYMYQYRDGVGGWRAVSHVIYIYSHLLCDS